LAVALSTVQTPSVPQPLRLTLLTVAVPLPPLLEMVSPVVAAKLVVRPLSARLLFAVSAVTVSLPTSVSPWRRGRR
jgi:hypothetical protein